MADEKRDVCDAVVLELAAVIEGELDASDLSARRVKAAAGVERLAAPLPAQVQPWTRSNRGRSRRPPVSLGRPVAATGHAMGDPSPLAALGGNQPKPPVALKVVKGDRVQPPVARNSYANRMVEDKRAARGERPKASGAARRASER
jgi:hypothetical protein